MLNKLTAARNLVAANPLIAAGILLCAALTWSSGADAQSAVDLTSAGSAAIWRSLGKDATRTSIPAGLHVGEQVPDTMHLLAFGRHLRKKVPAIEHYVYALVQGQVLIVDPRAKTIVAIVSK